MGYDLDLKTHIKHTFRDINLNLEQIRPTKVEFENAICKPLHQAFKSVPKQEYHKLYREISRGTHPDKIANDHPSESTNPILMFQIKVKQLAEQIDPDDPKRIYNIPQQLVLNYKERLPDITEFVSLATHYSLFNLINILRKKMFAVLAQSHYDSQRYNIYAQYAIYAIQSIVNVILIASIILLINLFFFYIIADACIKALAYFSKSFALLFMMYMGARFDSRIPENGFLLFFIGKESLDNAIKEIVPISQLAKEYSYQYSDELAFTEEDSDETILAYAKSKHQDYLYDIEYKKLHLASLKNRSLWQYTKILSLGFYNAMQAPLPFLNQSLVSKTPSRLDLSYVLLRYKVIPLMHSSLVQDASNPLFVRSIRSPQPWIFFETEHSVNNILMPDLASLFGAPQMFNPNHLPIVHHMDNTLYTWNAEQKILEQLNPSEALLEQLPSQYIRSSDSIFYFDDVSKRLERLRFDNSPMSCHPKSQYILYHDHLFYFNSWTQICNEIPLSQSQLNAFKAQFPHGTSIDTLGPEDLTFVKANSPPSSRWIIGSFVLAVCLKILRAICFIPFIIMELMCHALSWPLMVMALALMYTAYAIKLGVTFALNTPLYMHEAFAHPQSPSASMPASSDVRPTEEDGLIGVNLAFS